MCLPWKPDLQWVWYFLVLEQNLLNWSGTNLCTSYLCVRECMWVNQQSFQVVCNELGISRPVPTDAPRVTHGVMTIHCHISAYGLCILFLFPGLQSWLDHLNTHCTGWIVRKRILDGWLLCTCISRVLTDLGEVWDLFTWILWIWKSGGCLMLYLFIAQSTAEPVYTVHLVGWSISVQIGCTLTCILLVFLSNERGKVVTSTRIIYSKGSKPYNSKLEAYAVVGKWNWAVRSKWQTSWPIWQ